MSVDNIWIQMWASQEVLENSGGIFRMMRGWPWRWCFQKKEDDHLEGWEMIQTNDQRTNEGLRTSEWKWWCSWVVVSACPTGPSVLTWPKSHTLEGWRQRESSDMEGHTACFNHLLQQDTYPFASISWHWCPMIYTNFQRVITVLWLVRIRKSFKAPGGTSKCLTVLIGIDE